MCVSSRGKNCVQYHCCRWWQLWQFFQSVCQWLLTCVWINSDQLIIYIWLFSHDAPKPQSTWFRSEWQLWFQTLTLKKINYWGIKVCWHPIQNWGLFGAEPSSLKCIQRNNWQLSQWLLVTNKAVSDVSCLLLLHWRAALLACLKIIDVSYIWGYGWLCLD